MPTKSRATTKLLVLGAGMVVWPVLSAGACGGSGPRARPEAGTAGGSADDGGIIGGSGGAAGGSGEADGSVPISPPEIASLAGTFVSVRAGPYATCAVKADGTIVCWGDDENCCATGGYSRGPVPAGNFTSASVGLYHACGVQIDGTIACWGDDVRCGICAGPAAPPAGAFFSVSAGGRESCGVRMDGPSPAGAIGTGPRHPPAPSSPSAWAGFKYAG